MNVAFIIFVLRILSVFSVAGATLSSPPPAAVSAPSKLAGPLSPNSNVVVLPSGMSIHIKGLQTEFQILINPLYTIILKIMLLTSF